jgi:hypothetical protein
MNWKSMQLKDDAFSSSSDFNSNHAAKLCRLNSIDGQANWSAKKNDRKQWLQIDLGKIESILGVAVQGRFNLDQWVTMYNLQISSDLNSWKIIENILGCNDRNTINEFLLEKEMLGRYVRFIPKEWHNHISMRVDVAVMDDGVSNIEKQKKKENYSAAENIDQEHYIKVREAEVAKKEVEVAKQAAELSRKEAEVAKKEAELNFKLAKIEAEEKRSNELAQKETQKKQLEALKKRLIEKQSKENIVNSQKEIDPIIELAKSGKIIESSLMEKVESISQLNFLQLEYLNSYNRRDSDQSPARNLLRFHGVQIQRIKFAVKVKKATEKAEKGEVITFNAYYYSDNSKALTKAEATSYIEYTWLQKGGRISTNDAILGYFSDFGDNRFWNRVGFYSHRKGADSITKPEIIEITSF